LILPVEASQHDLTLLSHILMFFLIHNLYCHSACIYLLYAWELYYKLFLILLCISQQENFVSSAYGNFVYVRLWFTFAHF
jgi:hypothetical protein